MRETDPAKIEAELARLLAERRFSGAPQMSAFLRYIITQTLAGNADRIKAYSVGVDALGKPDNFDAQNDPSVRVLALRLRKTLNAIYATDAPAHAIVELKVGTYVPEFLKVTDSDNASFIGATTADDTRGVYASQNTGLTTADAALAGSPSDRADPVLTGVAGSLTSADSANQEIAQSNGKYVKLLMGAVVVIAALWQVNGAYKGDAQIPALSFASVTPISLQAMEISPRTGLASTTIPTLYLHNSSEQSEFEQQLSVLLGSSFVRAGTVNVIKPMATSPSLESPSGSYQLMLTELAVQGQSRVETQVVSMDTGEVLIASSMVIAKFENELSKSELESIEIMASDISSINGPVYRDFCQRYAGDKSVDCAAG